jgi:hypothetical protein
VNARERAPAENDSANGARSFIVGDAHITAAGVFLDGHFGNDGDAHAGANHAEDAAELAALEDDLRINPCAVASGNGGVTEAVPVAKEQEGFLAQNFQGDGAPIRERVLLRKRREQAFGEKRKGVELVPANGQGEEGDIHSAGAKTFQQYGSDFFDDSDLRLRKLAREKCEMRREEIGRDSGNDADRERTADGIFALPDVALGGLKFAQDSAGTRKKGFPQIGEADGAAETVEKACPEFVFKLEDLLGKRRLSNVGLFGRAAKGAGFGHGAEVAELVQFHNGCVPLSVASEPVSHHNFRALL